MKRYLIIWIDLILLILVVPFMETYAQEHPLITPDNVDQLEVVATLTEADYNAIMDLSWSADSQYLAVSRPMGVFIYSTEYFINDIESPDIGSSSVVFSPVEPLLAIGVVSGLAGFYETGIYLQNLSTGEVDYLIHRAVTTLAFSPDGKLLASGSGNGLLYLWDVETRQRLLEVETTPYIGPTRLVFSPDGRMLVVHNSDNIQLWVVDDLLGSHRIVSEPKPARVLLLPLPLRGGISNIIFDSSGENLFFAMSETEEVMRLQQWTLSDSQPPDLEITQDIEATQQFRKYDTVRNIAIHPTENILALVTSDGLIYMVDTQTQEELAVIQNEQFSSPLQYIAFSPDGTMLAISGYKGFVFVLAMDQPHHHHPCNGADQ